MPKFYVTKYALSSGIIAVDAPEPSDQSLVVWPNRKAGEWGTRIFHGEGLNWHRKTEDAVARAKVMRDAKLRSMVKQADRLRALTFDLPKDPTP